jgi:MFS family permease
MRRLFPLYAAAFLQAFVLWYAIEKVFMHQIGFDDAGIGLMVAVYSASMLLVETPSGVWADRWSRKGVLVLAGITLAISSAIAGLSNTIHIYVISSVFWGAFYALQSGTFSAIVYDTLLEEAGDGEKFEKYYGWLQFIESAAWVSGALLGGLVSHLFDMRAAYLVTVPIALISIIVLWFFKEPQLHKASQGTSIKQHVINTFKALLNKKAMISLVAVIVMIDLLIEMLYEFSQLWLIALNTELVVYGPAFGLVLSAIGIGGILAGKVGPHRRLVMRVTFVVMILCCVALATLPFLPVIMAAQTLLGVGVIMLSVLLMRDLNDALPSEVRAGASSAVGTLSRLLLIPAALAFGALSTATSIFNASWLIVAIVVVAAALELNGQRRSTPKIS